MFDRFVRLAQARRAFSGGHFEDALGLSLDPLIRNHRKAASLRERVLGALMERSQSRLDVGSVEAAGTDLDLVLKHAPDHQGAQELGAAIRAALESRDASIAARRSSLTEAGQCLEVGDLAGALRAIAPADRGREDIDRLVARVEGQRMEALERIGSAEVAIQTGDFGTARASLRAAEALDSAAPVHAADASLTEAVVESLLQALDQGKQGDALLQAYEEARAIAPSIDARPGLRDRVAAVARQTVHSSLLDALRDGDWGGALKTLEQTPRADADALLAPFGTSTQDLFRVEDLRRRGDYQASSEALRQLAKQLSASEIVALADADAEHARDVDLTLTRAREKASAGDLVAARSVLLSALEQHSTHEAVRREMEVIEASVRDQAERLAAARQSARDGRLREAVVAALALAVQGPAGDEARVLVRDVQARISTVEKGVEQVLAAMHGRVSGSIEGLRHNAARLAELAEMQSDHPALNDLRAAVQAEIEGLEALAAVSSSAGRDDVASMEASFQAFSDARSRFLAEDRLEARFGEVVDEILVRVETQRGAGRLDIAMRLLDALQASLPANSALMSRWEGLRRSVHSARTEAERLVAEGLQAIATKDVGRADDALVQARRIWSDARGGAVRTLEAAVDSVRETEARLMGVERLAASDDVRGAHGELGQMGPTPSLFRTRIYDLKTSLARAQGLDHAFLLRVDEGGEFLVVRSESVSIGNLRDKSADLPILASLCGRHARIRRSLSFHGGMQDRIEPEQGEVTCDDEPVTKSAILKHGHRIRLGKTFQVEYRMPSKRSLTSQLTLRGHMVAGTDKVLLLKDRGRDGRILIGAGDDVHVRVPGLTEEIELFANKSGQIRVRCAGGGTMDGRPFSGEEPISAGAVVTCAKASFVLLPWVK